MNLKFLETIAPASIKGSEEDLLLFQKTFLKAMENSHDRHDYTNLVVNDELIDGLIELSNDNNNIALAECLMSIGVADPKLVLRILVLDFEEKAGLIDALMQKNHFRNYFDRAATEGHYRLVQLILSAGVTDYNRSVALIQAAENGHIRVVQVLLDAGSDAKSRSRALRLAVEKEHEKVVEIILAAGCDKEMRNRSIRIASENVNARIVHLLLNSGCDDNSSQGAFRNALRFEKFEVVHVLLSHNHNDNIEFRSFALKHILIEANYGILQDLDKCVGIIISLIEAGCDDESCRRTRRWARHEEIESVIVALNNKSA